MAADVTVPSWKPLEAACLPMRAQKWRDGVSEAQQASCHCPPSSLCPATPAEYYNVINGYNQGLDANGNILDSSALLNTKIPPRLFNRCCSPPICPAGTTLAGQIVPPDLQCNITCPADTDRVGHVLATGETIETGCFEYCPSNTYFANQRVRDLPTTLGVRDCGHPCPAGTSNAGNPPQRMTAGTWNCNVCPAGTPRAGQWPTVNGECHNPEVPCPAGTLYAGQLPSNIGWNCNPEQPCPAGTIYAGYLPSFVGDCNPQAGDGGGVVGGPSGDGGGDGGSGDCLSAESTLIKADGTRVALSDLKTGDRIEGIDGVAEVVTLTRIEHKAGHLFYRINDFAFLITGDHPIETTDGWKVVDPEVRYGKEFPKLKVGDTLVGKKGKVKVTSIKLAPYPKEKGAYNIATDKDIRLNIDGISVKQFNRLDIQY